MSDLGGQRSGWNRVKLGDVIRQVKDQVDPTSSGLAHYVAGGGISAESFRITDWGSVGDGVMGPAFRMRFREGHVLYKSRVPHGVAVADRQGICANTTFVLEANSNQLLQALLPYVLVSDGFRDFERRTNHGSTNLFLNYSDIAEFEFALPPLDEQRRMVAALSACEEADRAVGHAASAAARLIESMTEDMIRACLQTYPRRALGDFLADISYGCSSRSSYERTPSSIPILRIPNVLRGELDLSDLQHLELSTEERARYAVASGDVLMVRTNGNPDYVGRAISISDLGEPMVCASYLLRLRASNELHPGYLVTLLNSSTGRRYLRQATTSSAGNYNINTPGVRNQPVYLPPIGCQRTFVARLSAVRERMKQTGARQRATLELRKTLLQVI